jgi:hypothetical protein
VQLAFSVAIQFMVATVREGIHGGTVREGIHGGTVREEIHGGNRQRKEFVVEPSEKGMPERRAMWATPMMAFTPNNIMTSHICWHSLPTTL